MLKYMYLCLNWYVLHNSIHLRTLRIKNINFESSKLYLRMICASQCTSELYVVYLVQLYPMI